MSPSAFLRPVPVSVGCAIALVAVGVLCYEGHSPPRRSVCHSNMKNITILLAGRGLDKAWPRYGGKNFVLSLVAYGDVDCRNPRNLEVFFCPQSGMRIPSLAEWEDVTLEGLRTKRFEAFTCFAGRRNDEDAYRLSGNESEDDEPILGYRDPLGKYVLVGFASGYVRWYSVNELNLAPGEALAFGDASSNGMLRKLSDR